MTTTTDAAKRDVCGEYERLRDGTRVHLREAHAGDWRALEAFGRQLSEESVYRRFHCTPRHPGRALANAVCAPGRGIAPPERGTLIVLRGVRIVGVVQWLREPGRDEAEVALVVADDLRRRGVAELLLDRARLHAAEHGVHRLTGTVQGDNQPLLSMVAALDIRPRRTWHGGVCALSVDLGAASAPAPSPPMFRSREPEPDPGSERAPEPEA